MTGFIVCHLWVNNQNLHRSHGSKFEKSLCSMNKNARNFSHFRWVVFVTVIRFCFGKILIPAHARESGAKTIKLVQRIYHRLGISQYSMQEICQLFPRDCNSLLWTVEASCRADSVVGEDRIFFGLRNKRLVIFWKASW